ncbi:MAG: MFS transporter [Ignavibacteriaceae bacterium]|nr:MFS transporter [Ignavibacteriaceae bacterium]
MSTESKAAHPLERWLVLIFVSVMMFGNYYIYDSIGPIADMLKAGLNFTDENIGQLYSVYSIAAIVVLLIGGVIIDKYGTKKTTLFFGIVCTISAFMMAFSSDLTVMLTSRVVLGLGAEPMIVAVTTALAKWFKGKELGFAFGLNLTIARLGSVAADNSPSWAAGWYGSWQEPLMLAGIISLTCVVGGIVYFLLESRAEKRKVLGEAGETDKFVFSDVFKFGWSFWFVVALCVTFYSAVFPFRSFAIKFFMEAHSLERESAGFLNSVLPLSAMFATPLFGLLVDKVGKRSIFMMIGSLFLMPVFFIMSYTSLPLYIPVAMMGVAFSLIPAVMWPSVAYLVDSNKLGTAYSVMTLIQQIGLALFNWMIGIANDSQQAGPQNPEGYNLGMWLFSILGVLGLIFSFALRISEAKKGSSGLDSSSAVQKN